jgi:hypothetical protein
MSTQTPVWPLDRRHFLQVVGTAAATSVLVGLAGCSAFESDGELTVIVANEDDSTHVVGATVTDNGGTVVKEFPAEAIQPGVSTSFTGDGFGGDEYLIAVQEGDDDRPKWRHTAKWGDIETCTKFTYDLRITRQANGNEEVIVAEACESS